MATPIYRAIAVFTRQLTTIPQRSEYKILLASEIEEIPSQVRLGEPLHFELRFSPIANVLTSCGLIIHSDQTSCLEAHKNKRCEQPDRLPRE
jgi:hypothetical protein